MALESVRPFTGAGLYALYYKGDLPIYADLDGNVPVYVGRAEAGNSSYGDPLGGRVTKLYERISKHRSSIRQAEDLSDTDFDVRFLRLDDVWIVLGERALLRAYSPVLWNALLPGFGANSPGGARTNPRSLWDTFHPGRRRAAGHFCNREMTRQELKERVQEGIRVSLMPRGDDRVRALDALRRRKYEKVWALAKKKDRDRRHRVFRQDAFQEENAAFNVSVDKDEWRDASAEVDLADVDTNETEGSDA